MWNATRHVVAVHRGDRDVVVAIDRQHRNFDLAKILSRLSAPGLDRLQLP